MLPDGIYDFTLLIEGIPVATARVSVGGAPQPIPSFADIVFGIEDQFGELGTSGYLLPAGVPTANARFVYQNMAEGTEWTQLWYYQGAEIQRVTSTWTGDPSGVMTIGVSSEQGLFPGQYRLELYIGNRLAATADMVVAGGQIPDGTLVFEPISFAEGVSESGEPAGITGEYFVAGTGEIYAFFDYQNIAVGTPWRWRWLFDDEPILERYGHWSGPETGAGWWAGIDSALHLPDGAYTFELWIGNELLQSATAEVGIGSGAGIRLARAGGIQLIGDIVDAETGRGIPGAIFLVLSPEFSVEDFYWDMSQVYSWSVTDSQGHFEVPAPLPPGELYSIVVRAPGYLPLNADAIPIDEDTPNPLYMLLEMNRD